MWLVTSALAAPVLTPTPDGAVLLPGELVVPELAAADFDGDGSIDLAWAALAAGELAVAYGGAGPPVLVDLGGATLSVGHVAATDLDGDGYADLLATTSAGVKGWRGGVAGVGAPTWDLAGQGPISVLGDVDGDGFTDVAVGLDVHRGGAGGPVADGTLPGALVFGLSRPWAVGDVDLDGRDDLLVPDHVTAGAYWDGMDGPAALVRRDAKAWSTWWSVDVQDGTASLAVACDVDGDAVVEVVSIDATRADESLTGALTVLDDLANPLGPTAATSTALVMDIGQGLGLTTMGDPDGDGDDDVLLGYRGMAKQLRWDPVLGFDVANPPVRQWGDPMGVVNAMLTIDLDGDGVRDLIGSYERDGDTMIGIWLSTPEPPGPGPGPNDTAAPTGPVDTDPPGTTPPATTSGPDVVDTEGGCGCRTGAPGVGWLALAALTWRRRRARSA